VTTSKNDLQAALDVARRVTLEAGAAIRGYFKHSYEINQKGYDNPVTSADLAADRILREGLTAAFPDDGWLSEETADDPARLARSRVWVVDPVDGTKEFIMGIPEFAVSVALVQEGQVVLGIVYNPGTTELFHAIRGGGAFLNGEPMRVSRRAEAPGARVPASRSECKRGEFEPFTATVEVVPTGSIAYKMALVACGRGDATWSQGPKHEWDVCGGALLVQEAGGRVSDLACLPYRFNQPKPKVNGVVATNGVLHTDVMALLGRAC
jgi:myo-inositol-1(or 4)-monophosphatase